MEQISQLSEEVTRKLLQEIRSGRYSGEKKLPPEVTLARELGVSRNLLRDCLTILEREGFISRKHGVGTVINKHVLKVKTRMDLEKEFLEMVADAGYEAQIAFVEIHTISCPAALADRLELTEGEPVFEVKRLITADGRAAIYCIDYIGKRHIKKKDYDEAELKKPIFWFLENACGAYVAMDLTEVSAVAADEGLAGVLGLSQGDPVLFMDETGYDFYGSPVLVSKEYYVNGILKHMVMRRKM